jgi:7,8-dihydropterin-6-yl-methyl-4-(beta-D-ribofuranosyl)aminobenzene 5'-phosphate synthase
LIISSDKNLFIVTGCSHPGIVNIVKRAMEIKPESSIEIVTGGFHLLRHSKAEVKNISDELKKLGVKKIAPSHCTGDEAINIFRKEWGADFVNLNLGDTFEI